MGAIWDSFARGEWVRVPSGPFYDIIQFMLYSTILADPPWRELGGGKIKRGADKHYSVMRTEDIMALDVEKHSASNSHLYLWVTNSHLPDGLRVMAAWGFRYITTITWAKDRMGLGQYYRGQTEHVLFGVRGNIPYRVLSDGKRAQGRTLLMAKRKSHSEKPEEVRVMIERVSPGPYLELFARKQTPGWHTWGKEIFKDVEVEVRNGIDLVSTGENKKQMRAVVGQQAT